MVIIRKHDKKRLRNRFTALPLKHNHPCFLQRHLSYFLYSLMVLPFAATSAQFSESPKITASYSHNTITVNDTTYALTATENKNGSIDYTLQTYDNSAPASHFTISVIASDTNNIYRITSDTDEIKATASIVIPPGRTPSTVRLLLSNNQTNPTITTSQTTTPKSIYLNTSLAAENSTSINTMPPSSKSPLTGSKSKSESKNYLATGLIAATVIILGLVILFTRHKSNGGSPKTDQNLRSGSSGNPVDNNFDNHGFSAESLDSLLPTRRSKIKGHNDGGKFQEVTLEFDPDVHSSSGYADNEVLPLLPRSAMLQASLPNLETELSRQSDNIELQERSNQSPPPKVYNSANNPKQQPIIVTVIIHSDPNEKLPTTTKNK